MTSLATQNLSIIRNGRPVCQQLTLTLQAGDYWGILGPNGSGKTTLLHTLCGQLPFASGEIMIDDRKIKNIPQRELAQNIGILFQKNIHHFPQSVSDYCLDARFPHHSLFTATQDQAADERLLQHVFNAFDLTALAHKNIQQLSGGEQRRAAIAALAMQTPQIYLLDEPANHLDLPHQVAALNYFSQESALHAVMMSTHDINIAAHYCNKILLLFCDGRVLHGPRDAMLTPELLSELYQHPIDAIRLGDQTYWQPNRTKFNEKELPWQYAY